MQRLKTVQDEAFVCLIQCNATGAQRAFSFFSTKTNARAINVFGCKFPIWDFNFGSQI